jgi:eukaryotic-like serine/threonine-protein kinase
MTDSNPMIDQTISHYRVLEKLGSGGGASTKLRISASTALSPWNFFLTTWPGTNRCSNEFAARRSLLQLWINICTIYAIGEENGRSFIAMELLEGKTLQGLIAGSPVELGILLDLAIEVADALDAGSCWECRAPRHQTREYFCQQARPR